jgi:hypothetical protein
MIWRPGANCWIPLITPTEPGVEMFDAGLVKFA